MTLAFGAYTLDGDRRELLKGADAVHLSPKAYALLVLLLERRSAAVAKEEIHERLWSGTFVADVTLASVVAEVRAALGESARQARLIRTAHSFGYAFAGQAVAFDAGDAGVGPACWLSSRARQITLQQGANLLGRDRTAGIWLDSVSVSGGTRGSISREALPRSSTSEARTDISERRARRRPRGGHRRRRPPNRVGCARVPQLARPGSTKTAGT
jgi:DNA-binding winged helix-turn-helix (wHTH) protein